MEDHSYFFECASPICLKCSSKKKMSVFQTLFCLFTSPFAENRIFISLHFFEAFRDQKTKGFTLWWDNQLRSHQGTSLSEENNYLDKLQPVKNTIFLIFVNKLLTKNEKQFLPWSITAIEMFWFILVTLVCDYRYWNMQSWIGCRRSDPKSILWFSM